MTTTGSAMDYGYYYKLASFTKNRETAIKAISRKSNFAQEYSDMLQERKDEYEDKLEKGETEPTFQLGAKSYTQKEFDCLLDKVDRSIEQMKKENEQIREQQKKAAADKKLDEKVREKEEILKRLDEKKLMQERIDKKIEYFRFLQQN